MIKIGELMLTSGVRGMTTTLWQDCKTGKNSVSCPDDTIIIPIERTGIESNAGDLFYRCFAMGSVYFVNEVFLQPLE